MHGYVSGAPHTWLRLEGLAILCASALFYEWQEGSWITFALLFLIPDISIGGYLVGPGFGARLYNLAHNYVGPVFLAVYSLTIGRGDAVAYALIWSAHIGLDRLAGLGLKYPSGFGSTHLGSLGKWGSRA